MNEFNYEGWIGSVMDNYASISEFPDVGSEDTLYIVRNNKTATAYVWDDESSEYVVLAGGGGGGGGSQSDWNENDSSSAAYVKNRTHWEEKSITATELEGQYCVRGMYRVQISDAPDIDLAKTYTVVLNGQTYDNLVPFSVTMQGLPLKGIGNMALLNQNGSLESNLPFLYAAANMGGQTIAVVMITDEVDSTFTINETGSSDTPYAVDFTGAQYSLMSGTPLSDDAYTTIHNQSNTKTFHENNIGEDIFEMNEGDKFFVTYNGVEYVCQANMWNYPTTGLYLSDGSSLDDATFYIFKYTAAGTGKAFSLGVNVTDKTENNWTGLEIDNIKVESGDIVVHKLNEKYLPDTVSNIPDAPSSDGTYALQVTVNNGTATYSWVATS